MIYIKNQICLLFNIGDKKDFISPNNLKSFELYENAGNLRPVLKLKFTLEDISIINLINAGNLLQVCFGIDEPSTNPVLFQFTSDTNQLNYSLGSEIDVTACLYMPHFMDYKRCDSTINSTSIEVIQKIAKRNKLNVITNITKTNDRQNWYQNGKTDWNYLKEVWTNTYINNDTFIAYAIDYDNIYIYDIRKSVITSNKWEFRTDAIANNSSHIVNYGQYWTTNQYGTTSSLLGKNIINTTYNVDTGEFTNSNYKLKNLTLLDSEKINLNVDKCRNYSYDITCQDYHSNSISAINQNIRNNIMFSSYSIVIPTAGQFKKFRLLDCARIISGKEDRRIEGLSFITSITYQYVDGRLLTNVVLNKEAPNSIKGANLEIGV